MNITGSSMRLGGNHVCFPVLLIAHFISSLTTAYGQEITPVNSKVFFEEFQYLLNDSSVVIIDGRTPAMFAEGHLENAINIDADAHAPELIQPLMIYLEKPLLEIYCTTVR